MVPTFLRALQTAHWTRRVTIAYTACLTQPKRLVLGVVSSFMWAGLAATSTARWICTCGTPCACLCVPRQGAGTVSTFGLAHKLAAVTAMPQLKYVYFPGNLRVQCVCLLDRLHDPLPHAACTDCRCAQQCFLTWEASQNTMLSAVQQTATLVACSRSMSLAMASHCVMAFRFGTTVLCEFVVCGGVLHFVLAPLLVQAQLQVFHSLFSCAMLLCRGLLCALHFPCYFFCVYLYVFLQCSGFRLPTPTSPTSVREGCVCLLLCRLSLLSLEPCRNGRGETVCPNLFTSGGVCCPLFKV